MIKPHGGILVEQYIDKNSLENIKADKEIILTDRLIFDALMISIGGYSPLTGFVSEEDYISIVEKMRLKSGLLFAIPIALPVNVNFFNEVKNGEIIFLKDKDENKIGIIEVSGKFQRDLKKEALNVYGTLDNNHPGVQKIYEEGEYAISGDIKIVKENINIDFPEHFITPKETRAYFEKQGWKKIVAFQTRNPIHRAHEYITKVALETVDGLMIHPTVGEVKSDDIHANIRMECYKKLIENYYNKDRVLLNILPMAMRYAGPREAIHHAIVRQNYGCTHIIIGRDHAGVGNYYGSYDAQEIFNKINKDDLEIIPIIFENAFYCNKCKQIVTTKTCPHDKNNHLLLSGTKVREMLNNGEDLPEEFTHKEISDILKNQF